MEFAWQNSEGKYLLPGGKERHAGAAWNTQNMEFTDDINEAFVGLAPHCIRLVLFPVEVKVKRTVEVVQK